jgi:hypothetical protein
VVLGLGLANKHSVGLFAVALVIGVFLADGRRLVLNRWFLAGSVIAVAFTIPDIWWQAQHQWATIAMSRALAAENGGLANVAGWLVGQLIMSAVALVWVWVAGLCFLWRSGRPRRQERVPARGHVPRLSSAQTCPAGTGSAPASTSASVSRASCASAKSSSSSRS